MNDEPYNVSLTMQELGDAIASNRGTAPGPDGSPNTTIQNIPEESLPHILKKILNSMWHKSYIPSKWKVATIVSIAKPKKGSKDLTITDRYN